MCVQYHVTGDKNLPLKHIFSQEYQAMMAFTDLSSPHQFSLTSC